MIKNEYLQIIIVSSCTRNETTVLSDEMKDELRFIGIFRSIIISTSSVSEFVIHFFGILATITFDKLFSTFTVNSIYFPSLQH